MQTWTFELNNKPMSALKREVISFPAFSGKREHTNKWISACHVGLGPIPPGDYYIFDRQSGGLIGRFLEMFSEKSDWFALYAIDGKIDDETYCNRVKRGLFRLHHGRVSEGCITVNNLVDYNNLRRMLKKNDPVAVPGSDLEAYGKVIVR